MRSIVAAALGLGLATGLSIACGSSGQEPAASNGDAGALDASASIDAGPFAFSMPCTDSTDTIYEAPDAATFAHGDLVRCATGTTLTRETIQAGFVTGGTTARPPISGALEYRILYRTERATNPVSQGYATASVFLPDTPRAGALPVIAIAHGTEGTGGACANSKTGNLDPRNPQFSMVFTLVARGFAVVAADYAGYASYGSNPPAGYLFADDEAKSVLDAARALRQLAPKSFGENVVVVGYSQGGHSALSALAEESSYGTGGKLAGVVGYSPLWFNMGTWAAAFYEASAFQLADPASGGLIKYDIWYHYTHGELLDGPGHGVDVFAADKRGAIKDFVDTVCNPGDAGMITSIPGDLANLYDPDFLAAVTNSQALGNACPTDPTRNALCQKWKPRYAADRPHITSDATKVPTLLVRGGEDIDIPQDRFVCGTDRLTADGVSFEVCYEPTASHTTTIAVRGDYVADWVAHVALGEPAPAACPLNGSAIIDDAGAPITCGTPPSND